MVAFVYTINAEVLPEQEIGSKAPLTQVKMDDISGQQFSLDDIKKANGVLLIFTCNSCSWVLMWENRYADIATWAQNNKVGFVLVNSNETKRDGDDSMENMVKHANEKGYGNVHYVVDDQSKLANAIGAKTTPHVFLYNADFKLVYKGAIDDNPKDKSKVKDAYLQNALKALGAGKEITTSTTINKGCSIKRVL